MGKHTGSTDSKVLRRIRGDKRGTVFTPDSFKDLGTRRAIDLALMRHRDSGVIRQLDKNARKQLIKDIRYARPGL
jgi:hypothetical protein